MRTSLTAIAPTLAARLHTRREMHQQRRALARELAAFITPADRLELDEIVARHSADETRLVRELLRRQDSGAMLRRSR
jgi:hypothetical protein